MSHFAVIDPDGIGLSWAARLQDEGAEVLYYINEREMRLVGEGIVPKSNSLHETLAWAKNKKAIAAFMFSGMGKSGPKVAVGADDFVKMGVPVVLGGGILDRLENDREFGLSVAHQLGVRQPPTFNFPKPSAAREFLKTRRSQDWYFKPNNMGDCDTTHSGNGRDLAEYLDHFIEQYGDNKPCIVQMKIPGIALSTAAWFNGYTFLEPVEGTIENKKLMNDDVGPSTGCSLNVVWMYAKRPKIFDELNFNMLGTILMGKNCNPGMVDINALIAEEAGPWGPKGKAYFLEFTPRLGWDSETCSPLLLSEKLATFLTKLSQRTLGEVPCHTDRLAFGLHVSVSPYPYISKLKVDHRPSPEGKPLRGVESMWKPGFAGYSVAKDRKGFYIADDSGNVGCVTAVGTKVKELDEQAQKLAKEMRPATLQYRTDSTKVLSEAAKKLADLGYETARGII